MLYIYIYVFVVQYSMHGSCAVFRAIVHSARPHVSGCGIRMSGLRGNAWHSVVSTGTMDLSDGIALTIDVWTQDATKRTGHFVSLSQVVVSVSSVRS